MTRDLIDLSGAAILVVDDMPANLEMLRMILEDQAYRVRTASDGDQALASAAQAPPDLVLLDIMMPGLDGFETCRRLKAIPATAEVPVIFVTAKTDVQDVVAGFQAGAVDFITKPIKREEVQIRVRNHLQIRAMFDKIATQAAQLAESNEKLLAEIKEREHVQEELRNAKEVATAVIHNIGNVINSVNVSTHTMLQNLDHSKLDFLHRVNELLEIHQDELGAFLTHDPRGRLIPKFYAEIAKTLESQHRALNMEVLELLKHIDLIKEVSIAQQSFARHHLSQSEAAVRDLLDDTLKLLLEFGQGKLIQVRLDLGDVGEVRVPRVKMAHVFMNLVKNAKEALADNPPDNRRLAIEGRSLDDGRIELSFSDNGPGIAPEDAMKVFSYGFTTKMEGHGFGLAYCAEVLHELGGELELENPVFDRGVTFSMRLPKSAI